MISNFLWPKMDDMDTDNMWFQQMDGAMCHTPHAMMDILHERFEGMVISRGGHVNWPSRSCDLTPLDFFLWGRSYLKSQIYMNKSQTIDAFKVNITNAIQQIQPELFQRESHRKLDRPNTCHQAAADIWALYSILNVIKYSNKKKLSRYLIHNLFYLQIKRPYWKII